MTELKDREKHLEIRKYPNRRYYDTSRSRHVTLEDIHNLIRDGYEVRIIDSKSEHDITAKVLAQIILELDSPKLDIFPVPLLHRLIRSNEQLINDFVEKYFNQALNAFLDSQRSFEQVVRRAMGLGTTGVPDWTKVMWGALTPWMPQRNGGPVQSPSTAPGAEATPAEGPSAEAATPPAAGTDGSELRQMVTDLQKQVQVLRQQQRGAEPAPRRRSTKAKP